MPTAFEIGFQVGFEKSAAPVRKSSNPYQQALKAQSKWTQYKGKEREFQKAQPEQFKQYKDPESVGWWQRLTDPQRWYEGTVGAVLNTAKDLYDYTVGSPINRGVLEWLGGKNLTRSMGLPDKWKWNQFSQGPRKSITPLAHYETKVPQLRQRAEKAKARYQLGYG